MVTGWSRLLSFNLYRYLDNVVNKQSVSPPIPHLHALLTSGDDPPAEVDIFDLLKVSYEVSRAGLARPFSLAFWFQMAVRGWAGQQPSALCLYLISLLHL